MDPKPTPPADLWERLAEVEATVRQEQTQRAHPGPDWFTVAEYAKKRGLGERQAHYYLLQLYRQGHLERVQQAGGLAGHPCHYYRLKEKQDD